MHGLSYSYTHSKHIQTNKHIRMNNSCVMWRATRIHVQFKICTSVLKEIPEKIHKYDVLI